MTVQTKLDLFMDRRERFYNAALDMLATFQTGVPFYFSDFRLAFQAKYFDQSSKRWTVEVSDKWWGSLVKKMRAVGYRETGAYRRVPPTIPERNGGRDFQYMRAS